MAKKKPDFEKLFTPFKLSSLVGNRVLVLAPHADDETLGCGGAIALHRKNGDEVLIIILTDGSAASPETMCEQKLAYIERRESEARKAAEILGVSDIRFLREPDRGLECTDAIVQRISEVVTEFEPGIIYAPSVHEFHPDHRSCARIAWAAVAETKNVCRLCFYEINRPFKVDTLVDISAVMEDKRAACAAYESQLLRLDYTEFCLSLNRHRALTVSDSTTHVEAFGTVSSDIVSTRTIDSWLLDQFFLDRQDEKLASCPAVDIIIRTRDRPSQLQDVLHSIATQTYSNIRVIIVNDGAKSLGNVAALFARNLQIDLIEHRKIQSRAVSTNTALQNSDSPYIIILDDQNLLYPDHVRKLLDYLTREKEQVAFSDIHSQRFLALDHVVYPTGAKEVIFDQEFSRDGLLVDNIIPIMAVMFSRECLDRIGLFDEAFKQYEDWDFLIRLSAHFNFNRLPGASGEYRFLEEEMHPERQEQNIVARLAIYSKHADEYPGNRLQQFAWTQIYKLHRQLESYRLRDVEALSEALRELKVEKNAARELKIVQEQLDAMRNSTSWRLTAPLRGVRNLVHSFQRKPKL